MKNTISSVLFLFLLLGIGLLPGCPTPDPKPDPKEATYQMKLAFAPTNPLPERPTQVTVKLTINEKDGLADVNPTLVAKKEGAADVSISLDDKGNGSYESTAFPFPSSGDWSLELSFNHDEKEHMLKETVKVTCQGTKANGSFCCNDTHCNSGLYCVYGTCQSAKGVENAKCYAASECASGACTNGVCEGAKCDDNKKNGNESDVDCGGACGPCNFKQTCNAASDCNGGDCTQGICGPGPGELLGKKGGLNDPIQLASVVRFPVKPADLSFNYSTGNLWVVHPDHDALTAVTKIGTPEQSTQYFRDGSQHFLEEVVAISFGDAGTFGTCGDSRNTYGNRRPANDFMGPVLWPSSLAEFEKYKTRAHDLHYDMLHGTSQCMGIASETKNQYFVFNGQRSVLDWYDFRAPHVPGGTDHSDGVKRRFPEVKLQRVAGVPSNLVFAQSDRWLYIADTGNGRVIRVNIDSAKNTRRLQTFRNDGVLWEAKGVKLEELVKPGSNGLKQPSGLALYKKTLYVADHATGIIQAYDLEGNLLNQRDTKLGANKLGGLVVGSDKHIYVVDMVGNQVVRIDY